VNYVRTKYGIIDIRGWIDYGTYYQIWVDENRKVWLDKEDIIKESDTIKNLCDCFKNVSEYANQFSFTTYLDFEQARFNKNDHQTLYGYINIVLPNGAIRIEPVAKMNEEGNLILLYDYEEE